MTRSDVPSQVMSPVSRTSPLPLWAQVENDLRRRLAEGEFGDGAFPTDLELTNEYGVSRHTVREAVRRLCADGIVTRERGRGTTVNTTEFEQPLGTLYSLFRAVEETGAVQTSRVLELGIRRDDRAAAALEVEPDTELFHIARLRLADDVPLAVDRAWLPAGIARPLLQADWTRTALYDELAVIGAPVPTDGLEWLTPIIPTPTDADLLDLKGLAAVFHLERLGRAGGRPIEHRVTLMRGDRFRYVSEWSASSASQFRAVP